MEPTENPDEGFETSSAKVVTGVRTLPELKMQLTNEAGECGMSTSEYCELLLLNRHEPKTDAEQLALRVKQQQQEIERMKTQAVVDAKQLEVAGAEVVQLRKKLEEQNNQLVIYSDKRLLYLYENVKGRADTVEDAYHDNFGIRYNTLQDVLKALIYSSKLNQ